MSIYKNLVLGGGGVTGIAYSGAIEQLAKEPDFDFNAIENVAGTSAGAITAMLISLRFTPAEISKKLAELDFSKLEDGYSRITQPYYLAKYYGIYQGDELYKTLLSYIKEKTNRDDPEKVTFGDLQKLGFPNLHIITAKAYILNGQPEMCEKIFGPEKHANTPIAPLVRASASAPSIFQSVRLKKIAKGCYLPDYSSGHLYVDGGMLQNFPIGIFDKKYKPSETLGLALRVTQRIIDKQHKPVKQEIGYGNPISFFKAAGNALIHEFLEDDLDPTQRRNLRRTIQIDRKGVHSFNFNLDDVTKKLLIESGKEAVQNYFTLRAKHKMADAIDDHGLLRRQP